METPEAKPDIHTPRRKDRTVEDESWIRAFLHRSPVGNLATVVDSQPFINSNLFVFDDKRHCIYLHTARTGRTRFNVQTNRRVCFAVSEMGRLLPADQALEMSVEYSGVIVFGLGAIVDNRDEARYGLNLLLRKYFPHLRAGRDYRAITDEELDRTTVFRVDIDKWSAKKKEVEQEFPGAFDYPISGF